MNAEILDADISTESTIRFEITEQKLLSRRILVCEVLVWLAFIAFLAGLFFALKLGVELGLKVVSHEITEQVRTSRGF